MIAIVCDLSEAPAAEALAAAIQAAYRMTDAPVVVTSPAVWNHDSDWDDLLLVFFGAGELAPMTRDYIEGFRSAHGMTPGASSPLAGWIFPVATRAAARRPPAPLTDIKALLLNETPESTAEVVRQVGVRLGLALKPVDYKIFVSYRASDGAEIATDVHRRLSGEGFNAWLDEAQDGLAPGDDVQKTIHDNIAQASMVLVVDTTDAPSSRWINEEIDTAIELGITAFPIVVGPDDVSRFQALLELRRRVPVKRGGADGQGLSDDEWASVLANVETLLLREYQRRIRLPQRAQRVFTTKGFAWTPIDPGRAVFRADRRPNPALPGTAVLSRCSVQDATYLPSLKAYASYVRQFKDIAEITHKVLVYESERFLSDPEIERLDKALSPLPFILANYVELNMLLESNFVRLR